jgi:hypothetical protein
VSDDTVEPEQFEVPAGQNMLHSPAVGANLRAKKKMSSMTHVHQEFYQVEGVAMESMEEYFPG